MRARAQEIVVDSFAGGGGASTGIELALGRSPDIAINHDGVALSVHAANHPETRHLAHNIWKVDPVEACGGKPVGLLWASPDCKHFSKAKGSKPVEKRIRDLAWVVVRWAKQVAPRLIILENVEEFADWGPVLENGKPCPDRKGLHFRRFVAELRRLGYKVDWRELRACDYGAPTVRKRLFLIARRDGLPIVWPAPTHGTGRLPYRTAAEIIDWSLPCPSIFDTSAQIKAKYGIRAIRPLADNTMARIARGVKRYVIDAASPFIVPITHTGDARVHGLDEPLRTVTTAHRGEHALVTPFVIKNNRGATGHDLREPLHTITAAHSATRPGAATPLGLIAPLLVKNFHGEKQETPVTEPLRTVLTGQHHMLVAPTLINTRNGERVGQEPRCRGVEQPHPTVTAEGSQGALVAAFLAQHNTDMVGHDARGPLSTIVQKGCTQAVVSAGMINLRGTSPDQFAPRDIESPVPTISAGGIHTAEVRAFLTKYYGSSIGQDVDEPLHTATSKPRFGVATVDIAGEPYAIVDIGMRMLTPRELFRAQGFPDTYIIDRGADGTPVTKTDQIRLCGNSVCPHVAAALVKANYAPAEVTDDGVPAFALEAAE
jgi:DNA (cytosine-5)-methyltransferase 1